MCVPVYSVNASGTIWQLCRHHSIHHHHSLITTNTKFQALVLLLAVRRASAQFRCPRATVKCVCQQRSWSMLLVECASLCSSVGATLEQCSFTICPSAHRLKLKCRLQGAQLFLLYLDLYLGLCIYHLCAELLFCDHCYPSDNGRYGKCAPIEVCAPQNRFLISTVFYGMNVFLLQ